MMLEFIPGMLILLASIVNTYQLARQMRMQRKVAIEKGVSPFVFSLLTFTSALYGVPVIAVSMLGSVSMKSTWFPFLAVFCYFPGIFLANMVYDKVDRGYDYQRKAAQKIKNTEWGGYFLLFISILMWAFFYFVHLSLPSNP